MIAHENEAVASERPLDVAALRRRIEQKISAAAIDTSPFPHLIIEDFFPADLYAKILAYNPFKRNAGSEWYSRGTSANTTSLTPYFARKQINFHRDDSFDAPPAEQAFWNGIKACFFSDHWFEQIVAAKYHEYFAIRFGDLMLEPDPFSLFKQELFLQRHDPGYYIGPHTDVPTRVFTCIFSFASQDGFEEFGTELLAHRDPLIRCWGNDHYKPDEFVVRKLAPYKPNNFLLFFKTRQSFHSVKAITPEVPDERFGMQFQLYEPSGGVFNDLSVPDIMSVRMKAIPKPPETLARKVLRRTGVVDIAKRTGLTQFLREKVPARR